MSLNGEERVGRAVQRDGALSLEDRVNSLAGRVGRLRELSANVVAGVQDDKDFVIRDNLRWIEESAKEAAIEAVEIAAWCRALAKVRP